MTGRLPAPLPWLAGLLALYLVAPLAAGAQQVARADWGSVDWNALVRACGTSIASATVATLIIALGGIPLGYVLARFPARTFAAVGFLVQLPLALPPLASGILLLFLVGYSTPLGRLAHGALTDSFAGIVLAEVFVAAPFLIVAARSAFGAMDATLEGVAATLGRGPPAVFFRVSLPIAWPTILSGLLLAWLRGFGEFGATVMVAYHPYSLPVYTYVAFGAQGLPAMLPVLLPALLLALLVMALSGSAAGQGDGRQRAMPMDGPSLLTVAATLSRSKPVSPSELALRLEKRLGAFRLDLAWSPAARRLAILGPSGSGKSLTLKLIAGIERCGAGSSIAVDGKELSQLGPAARAIAYVPQNYGLFPHLTTMEQLRFPADADHGLAEYWLDRLGLRGLEQRRPAALSLGQQQRVALARALVRPANLMLLDEPFSALDAPLRARLRQELCALQEEIAAVTILVTHDPTEAALLADELLVIADGRALQAGPTRDVFMRPAGEIVARLLGADTVAQGVAADANHISVGAGILLEVAGPALNAGEPVGWSVSPARAWTNPAGAHEGTIESRAVIGAESRAVIRFGDARIGISEVHPEHVRDGVCRFDIDRSAVQVWPLA